MRVRNTVDSAVGRGAAGRVLGDEASHEPLGPGECIGDPAYGTCKYIRDIPHFPVDVPSAFLKDGKIVQPAREIACFRETDVVVVGGLDVHALRRRLQVCGVCLA